MLEPLAETAAVTWPVAMTLASVAVVDRVRAIRRRGALNRAIHELRRPLQALVLAAGRPPLDAACRGQLELALDALAALDREVNGTEVAPRLRNLDARRLAAAAVERWRGPAALAGRRIEFDWRAGRPAVACDESRIGRAIDNLIANALEHGARAIRVEGSVRKGRLRLVVADGADAGLRGESAAAGSGEPMARRPLRAPSFGGLGDSRRRNPRRGHGLRIVAAIAAEHGGRFAICRHERGASAVLELPLAD